MCYVGCGVIIWWSRPELLYIRYLLIGITSFPHLRELPLSVIRDGATRKGAVMLHYWYCREFGYVALIKSKLDISADLYYEVAVFEAGSCCLGDMVACGSCVDYVGVFELFSSWFGNIGLQHWKSAGSIFEACYEVSGNCKAV